MILEERFEKLEKKLARAECFNRCLLGALLLVVTVGILGAAAEPKAENVIRANQFIVEDENGKPRVILSAGQNGPSLNMADENGKVRAVLNVRKDGPGLGLLDENGKTRVILSLEARGTALGLKDENGKLRIALSVSGEEEGLLLRDENGKPAGSLP